MKCSDPNCNKEARPGGKTCWDHVPGPDGTGFGSWQGSRWRNVPEGVKELSKRREDAARAAGRHA